MGSLVSDFDSFIVMLLSWLLSQFFDFGFHIVVVFAVGSCTRINRYLITLGVCVASRCSQLAPLPPTWNEHRNSFPVRAISVTKLVLHLAFLTSRQQEIGENDDGKKHDRKKKMVGQ